jgi:hypothetical protein
MKTLTLITICLCSAVCGYAQSTVSGFQIRKSFEASDDLQKPAEFMFTAPHEGSDSWLVDAGAAVTLGKLSAGTFTSKLTAEYHRNTLIDAEQNNFQAGYNFNIFNGSTGGAGSFYATAITGTVKYVSDKIKGDKSFAATFNFTPYISGGRNAAGEYGFNLGRPGYTNNWKNTYQVGPALEVQYQQVISSASGATGGIIRPLVDLFAAFSINKRPCSRRADSST